MSTGPGAYSLKLYRGDTYQWQFVLWSDTAKTQPINLTGATARSQIRDKVGGSILATLICTVQTPNIINMSLNAANSGRVANGLWDLEIDYGNGNVQTILRGTVAVTDDVTV